MLRLLDVPHAHSHVDLHDVRWPSWATSQWARAPGHGSWNFFWLFFHTAIFANSHVRTYETTGSREPCQPYRKFMKSISPGQVLGVHVVSSIVQGCMLG